MNAFLSAKVYICIMSNLVTTWLSNYKDMYCEPCTQSYTRTAIFCQTWNSEYHLITMDLFEGGDNIELTSY